jgi:Xaa-Pro dipeptidase
LVRACRLIKSPAELALMQIANNVTIEALRYVHAQVARGMSASAIAAMMNDATFALGAGSSDFSLVLLNEASAYPHGSVKPQEVRDGSTILMDCGCSVHGYQSDISRTCYYESEGWGPGYRLPGLSHRTGHGIGMDGHEPAYLVHGDATPLQAGMCFSDEPGIYIPGEFGIRLEDCWHMGAAAPQLFTPLAKSLDQPI